MEAIILEDSPLADYLEGDGGYEQESVPSHDDASSSNTSSPSFAPRGKPTLRSRFKNKLPPPLRLVTPTNNAISTLHTTCSKVVNSRLGRADNARFLERFRYLIVASQLLNAHSYVGQTTYSPSADVGASSVDIQAGAFTVAGAVATALSAFLLVWLFHWAKSGASSSAGRGRAMLLLVVMTFLAMASYTYMRRQWLQYLRQQSLEGISDFVVTAHDFDRAATGALTLVQEVELVSRGYKISSPLPPISRLEDQSQSRRCARLRKQLRICFANVITRYHQACLVLKPCAEEMDLDKFFDIYDVSDSDFADAMVGFSETEFEDAESLRVLKILAARFDVTRKIFLCYLMALEADGGKLDFVRWTAALDEIKELVATTGDAEERLRRILIEEESFPVPATPKVPLTPGRERWRAQLRKLNSLSSGIRGLSAKLHVLREESDKNLNETEDVAELGTNLMIQYESIGIDLKALMQEWEDGKTALASNIDRNHRRVSSMGGMLSPTTSLGGLTAVDEGSVLDALQALNGEARSRSSMDLSSSDAEEVFEAIAIPRQRSNLTREERIAKMRDDRVKRDSVKTKSEANTKMLRELESVINLRPRGRTAPGGGRITSI